MPPTFDILETHHERWDGTGGPNQLAGEDIPMVGRITAVADVFDALISKRCYKDAMPLEQCAAGTVRRWNSAPLEQCIEIMRAERVQHFDPKVLDAFPERIDEPKQIVVSLSDHWCSRSALS